MNSVSNFILEVEVRCHKVQGMTEAFTDTMYTHAKTSSSVHQKPYQSQYRQSMDAGMCAKILFHIVAISTFYSVMQLRHPAMQSS